MSHQQTASVQRVAQEIELNRLYARAAHEPVELWELPDERTGQLSVRRVVELSAIGDAAASVRAQPRRLPAGPSVVEPPGR
jgi:hypothetical protein